MSRLEYTPNPPPQSLTEQSAKDLALYLQNELTQISSFVGNISASTENSPTSAIVSFASPSPPEGWLECNGAAISRSDYSDLFNSIGVTYGAGDGTTTFNLPELRGEFLRGWDNGRGVDAGRVIASGQGQQLQSHDHFIQAQIAGASGGGGILLSSTSGITVAGRVLASGGAETRPRNVAVLYCIKY